MRRPAILIFVLLIGCPPPTAPRPPSPLQVEAPDPAPITSATIPKARPPARRPSKPLVTDDQQRRAVEWAKKRAIEEAQERAAKAALEWMFGDD